MPHVRGFAHKQKARAPHTGLGPLTSQPHPAGSHPPALRRSQSGPQAEDVRLWPEPPASGNTSSANHGATAEGANRQRPGRVPDGGIVSGGPSTERWRVATLGVLHSMQQKRTRD